MSRLDDLPPDQRATLSLLLRSRKSYAEVATLLDIQERAVHDRAHAALAVLAARQARELTAERREEVGDYLLGQRRTVAERLATRSYLESSSLARDWAKALAGELARVFSSQPLEHWLGVFDEEDVCVGPVATLAEAASDLGTPAPGRAPELGAHTDAWRAELGL